MSRELIVKIRCDMDKVNEAKGTVQIAVDGVTHVVDLCGECLADYHAKLDPILESAHEKIGKKGKADASNGTDTKGERRAKNSLIRRWAASQGFEIGDKGAIPVEVRRAFERFDPSSPDDAKKQIAAAHGKKGGEIARLRALPKELRDEVKAWGRKNGYPVSSRGFVSGELLGAYEKANGVRISA